MLSNATRRAFARNDTLEITNEALLEKDNEMKMRVQHSKKQLGKGQIMGQDVLEERKVDAQFNNEEKDHWDIWKYVVYLFKDAVREATRKKVAMTLDERIAIAQLRPQEKEQWDVWKDVIMSFRRAC